MGSIKRRPDRSGRPVWRAYYRTPEGKQRNKSFPRKVDAERFLARIESTKTSGSYIDPAMARVSVEAWASLRIDSQGHLKPSTRERYAGIIRTHVLPRWGHLRLGDVSHAAVQSWVAELTERAAPGSVVKIYRVFSQILEHAVRDGRLARNPAKHVRLPKPAQKDHVYLSHAQVADLAAYVADPYRAGSRAPYVDREAAKQYALIVLFLAYTGVRWGEMAALRVNRINLERRRATIAESVTLVRGKPAWGTPKGHTRRDVPLPRFVAEQLERHVAGKAPGDLVFTGVKGGVLRAKVFQDAALTRAARDLGISGLTPHKLRHTAASLAIASGANVKVVQQMLGHKSATMTLDLYGHLFGDQLDEVADALDAARAQASARRGVSHLFPTGENDAD